MAENNIVYVVRESSESWIIGEEANARCVIIHKKDENVIVVEHECEDGIYFIKRELDKFSAAMHMGYLSNPDNEITYKMLKSLGFEWGDNTFD